MFAIAASPAPQKRAQAPFTAAEKALLAQGRRLYEKYSCRACHGEKGVGVGDLRRAYVKYSDEQIRNYIRNPRAGGNQIMPVFGALIPESDFPALIAYVKRLGEEAAYYDK